MDSRSRKRAVGTRDRVMSHLMTAGEVADHRGMASTVLAEAVGYPGSSVAFAQLLSGMERSGLIEREIRGKRTYRISAAPDAVAGSGAVPAPAAARRAAGTPGRRSGEPGGELMAAGAAEVDYDELARRLLVQVVERLAGAAPESPAEDAGLQATVASLEQKLATVQSKQRRLTAENAKLREQLRAAQQSLAASQDRAGVSQPAGQLDTAEVRLLERLLSPLRQPRTGRDEAGAG